MKREIFNIVLKYANRLAEKKPYNLQTIAINKNINQIELLNQFEIFNSKYNEFSDKYPSSKVQDNVLKNDGLNFRNMYLISPYHYLYYNYQVFLLFYFINETDSDLAKLTYNYQSIFYAGLIELNYKNISQNSVYNEQYSKFVDKRNSLENAGRVLSLDLKSFFDEIRSDKLINKLNDLVKNLERISPEVYKVINNIEVFLNKNKFITLPQIHFSVASSYLSQLYLHDSSIKFSKLLHENDSESVRYVDDTYIGFYKETTDKGINNFIKKTADILWEDGLILNAEKTRIIESENFKEEIQTINVSTDQDNNLIYYTQNNKKHRNNDIEFRIYEKINELISDNGSLLIEFFTRAKILFENNGYDFKQFNNLLDKYIAVDGGNVSKVLNNLMFNKHVKLTKNIKKKILNLSSGIKLYPEILAKLYIMFSKDVQGNDYKNELYDALILEPYFSHREVIISKYFIIQYKNNKNLLYPNNHILKESRKYSPKYTEYIFRYCI